MRIFRARAGREFAASTLADGQELSLLAETKRTSHWYRAKKSFRRHWQLYLVMVPALLYFFVFKYIPITNSVLAFKDYNVVQGIWGSPWAGFKYFDPIFSNPVFWTLIRNTLSISL